MSSIVDTCLSWAGLQRIPAFDSVTSPSVMSTIAANTRQQIANQSSGTGGFLYKWLWNGQYSIFPWIPKPIKYLVLLLFLLNAKSWPLVWHVKLWWPAIRGSIDARRKGVKEYYWGLGLFTSEDRRNPKVQPLIEKDAHHGNRFVDHTKVVTVRKYHAYFDDCDYNKHLSNSSYARNLDYSRMKACIEMFSPFFATSGWMALGAGSYQFAKEIPIFADYEVHVSIAGIEEKWMYLVAEFVTYPKKGKSGQRKDSNLANHKATSALQAEKSHSTKPTTNPMLTEVLSGSVASSGVATPVNNGKAVNPPASMQEQIAKRMSQTVRTDGSVLHCLGVSTYCFKVGRLTVPPRVVLSYCGYGNQSNWDRAQKIIIGSKDGGKKWLQGGWKDETEEVGKEFVEHELNEKGKIAGGKLAEAYEGLRETVDAALRG
ncbi:hypothetical protein QFC22_001389 [Naganishia vaughanmartiniae]|uniref:Uncharacterized protein n=1 Tax=Naganishia vaughanmartiniae TaxID=1424756 RepID=A0ACC2XIJ5_9TREE|nr:hypothetical protein QFC22_001389 [Naganishia vaughanmartiniae]